MRETAIESVLRRDRIIVILAIAVLTGLAWSYVLWLSAPTMGDLPVGAMMVSGMSMAPALKAWAIKDFALTFAMWAVMMVGMMTPSAAPMILLYARVGRQAAHDDHPFASSSWFAGGYLGSWAAFSIVATSAQWALTQASALSPVMALSSKWIGGAVLISIGIYQWTPLKESCLSLCRSPLAFIQAQGGFKRAARGSLILGARHGAYCVGCCWALMALLFVGGIMNVLWIAGISILVLLEKIAPAGKMISRATGTILALAGVWLIATNL